MASPKRSSDLAHEAHRNAQAVQRQAGVGNSAAVEIREDHDRQVAGAQQRLQRRDCLAKGRDDVYADMAGYDDLGLLVESIHGPASFCCRSKDLWLIACRAG